MPAARKLSSLILCLSAITGCIKYRPKPIDPIAVEKNYRGRSLSPGEPGFEKLVQAALELHPELAVAQARVQSAEAAIVSAKARPNPGVAVGGGGTNSPESPVVFRFDGSLLIETARKRDYRILQSMKLAQAARLELDEAKWRVRSRLRAALVDRVFALRLLESLHAEAGVRAEMVNLLEKRLAAGEIARPIVDASRIDLVNAAVAVKTAQGQAEEALVLLGAAIGVTKGAIEAARIDASELERLPALDAIPPAAVREAGLLNRIDVRRQLLQYAALEANLQLEIARQYPDVQISPGYSFDEGHYKLSAGPVFTLPVWNRNRGPIAEAEASRAEGAARFLALQAQAIAEMESGLARYTSALAEYRETESRRVLADRQQRAVEKALAAGEEDRVSLIGQQVQAAVLARLKIDAWRKAQLALGALEDSVQKPL